MKMRFAAGVSALPQLTRVDDFLLYRQLRVNANGMGFRSRRLVKYCKSIFESLYYTERSGRRGFAALM